MDEPLSNLDAKLRNQMRAEIIKLRERIDTTFIYVTHDQTEAMTLGDRIVIMKDGFIQQVGSPEEVFERPSNLFVAEFIGAPKMNTFRTNLILENGKYYVTPFGAKIEVDGETGRLLAEKQVAPGEVILGVRPEHINLAPAAAENTINGTVLVNEMMGSELHLHIATGDSKLVARIPTVDLSHEERKQLKNHFPAHLTFPGKVMYFFDPETEKNLLY
jgi:multiple sugar transport system ATP-binding protein